MTKEIKRALPAFTTAIAIPLAVGTASALLTRGQMDIYEELTAPPLAPAAILFPIIWSLLYILMGISSALVWLGRNADKKSASLGLGYYVASLAVNFSWSLIFFRIGALFFAFVWLILLLYLAVRTVICYRKVSPLAAYLQIPYILWLLFAGYLNLAIVILN